jgi:thiamine transport system ATP-binding protein
VSVTDPAARVAETAVRTVVGARVGAGAAERAEPVAAPPAAPRGLGVRDLVVRYDDGGRPTTAVDGVSLDVAPGEVVALLGPSGCGKSSLLRAIAGLEPAVAGTVTWDGVDLAGMPVHRRGFGLMFQEGQLFPHRDVARNVAFGLEMARAPRAARLRRVEELLRAVGLDGYGRRPVSTLSGGEQQRVALARALAPSPQLLLLDEPLSALDRSLRERLAADVRRTLVSTGTTALFVTHDHDEAFTVADRVAVMSAGRLLRVDVPARLWRDPGSRTVAEFLGYEAFVPLDSPGPVGASLRRAVGGEAVRGQGADSGSGADRRTAVAVAALAPGALVVGSGAAGADVLRGVVVQATFRRGRSEVVVDVDGVGRVTAVAPGVLVADPGDVVELTVDAQLVAVLPG